MKYKLPFFAVGLAVVAQAFGASPQNGEDLLKSKQWAKAETAFEQQAKNDPSNGEAWYGLGSAALSLKDYKAARRAFQKSVDLKHNLPYALYNLACASALDGDADASFSSLDQLVTVAPRLITLSAVTDPDLAAIREKADFKRILEKATTVIAPCLHDPHNRAFDFWLGEWEVFDNKTGARVGTSHVDLSLDGCLLIENWAGRFGDTGKSFNHLDPESGRWKQYWVSSNGSVSTYEGDVQDGVMRFAGTLQARGAAATPARLTFRLHPDGSVEQTGEAPSGAGAWNVTYDFIYRKKD